jgi:hypothetical protein
MPRAGADPRVEGKLSPRYRAVLVVAAVAILAIGSALRPRRPTPETGPPPSQTEVRRLRSLAERQSLETMTRHLAGIAADVSTRLVQVGLASETGVVWETDLVVAPATSEPSAESTTLVTDGGERLVGTRVVGDPDLPLSAYQAAGRLEPAARRGTGAADLAAGQWLVAVWRGTAGPVFAPAHFVETRPLQCGGLSAREVATSAALSEPMAGGALFDLDETMVAVVLPCDGRYAALSLESVTLGLVRGRSLEGRLRTLYGVRFAPLDEGFRRHLGAEPGVLVSEVWERYAADMAGLRPGDVVVEAGGGPVATPEGLQSLLVAAPPAGVDLAVWRAPRKRKLHLVPGAFGAPSSRAAASPGLGLTLPGEAFRVGPVAPGSPAEAAGIREGDVLVRVDGAAPRTPAEAARAFSRRKPVFVEVRRGGERRLGALLQPR